MRAFGAIPNAFLSRAASCPQRPPAAEGVLPKAAQEPAPAAKLQRPPLLARALPGLAVAALQHLHSAHAACIAAPHAPCRCVALSLCCGCENNGRCTPRARAPAEAASAGCARGNCLSSPQPSRAPQRYAPSSPPAAARLPCAAGGASFSSPPSPPLGRYPARYTVSAAVGGPVNAAWRPGCPRLVLGCQQLSLPRGAAQRAVAALWAPCFGTIRPGGAQGVPQATPAARILSMFPARQRGV